MLNQLRTALKSRLSSIFIFEDENGGDLDIGGPCHLYGGGAPQQKINTRARGHTNIGDQQDEQFTDVQSIIVEWEERGVRLKVEEGGEGVTDRRKSSEFLGKLAIFETDQTVEIQRNISKVSLPSTCKANIGCDKSTLFENETVPGRRYGGLLLANTWTNQERGLCEVPVKQRNSGGTV